MKILSTALLTGLFSLTLSLTTASPTLEFPQYGFEIDTLEAPGPVNTTTQALIMFLPASEGFAPNINVQIQTFPYSFKQYQDVSKKQFAELKWKMLSEKLEGNRWTIEYTGDELRFYAVIIKHNNLIYLATGCARESQWADVGEIIRKRVDSFKVTVD